MAISRVKTWNNGDTLTAADLNAEFNNIIDNPLSLISPLTGALDMNGQEFILDADGDSSITADTDDQIDFKIGGSDRGSWTSTAFTLNNNLRLNTAAMFGGTKSTLTLSTGAGTATGMHHIIAAESGTEDDFDTLTATNATEGDIVYLRADSGDTIYVTVAGNFRHPCLLSENWPTPFMWDGTKWNLMLNGWVLLDTKTASASATLDFTKGIGSAYDKYTFVLTDILPATDNVALYARVYDVTLADWQADASDYGYHFGGQETGDNGWTHAGRSAAAAQMQIGQTSGNVANEQISGDIHLHAPSTGGGNRFYGKTVFESPSNELVSSDFMGKYIGAANAISGVRYLCSSGNIASGTIALYGFMK